MNKKEAIAYMGLTKWDRDVVSIGNKLDTKQREVVRDIYIDGHGDEWTWLWGEFYRVKRSSFYGYNLIV